jgi:hypothetical protein
MEKVSGDLARVYYSMNSTNQYDRQHKLATRA